MGPWTKALLDVLDGARHQDVSEPAVTDLRIEPSLVTARVEGRRVALSAPPIPPGIWAAVASSVRTDTQSEQFTQLLAHTWDEPLVPEQIVRLGDPADVAAVARELADAVERDPAVLLRWRGYAADSADDPDAWNGESCPSCHRRPAVRRSRCRSASGRAASRHPTATSSRCSCAPTARLPTSRRRSSATRRVRAPFARARARARFAARRRSSRRSRRRPRARAAPPR